MAAEGQDKGRRAADGPASTAVADFATGIAIAWGVCAALFHRERTGRGQMVETNLLASALGVQTSGFMEIDAFDAQLRSELIEEIQAMREAGASYEEIDQHHQRTLNPWRRGNLYYRTYQAKDGALAVACLSDRLRKRVADVLGIYDPRFEPDFDPLTNEAVEWSDGLAEEAEALFLEKTVGEWLETFDRVGVPAGPVRYLQEMLDDEHVNANGLVVELEHSLAGRVRMVGPPHRHERDAARSPIRLPRTGRAYPRDTCRDGLLRIPNSRAEGERGGGLSRPRLAQSRLKCPISPTIIGTASGRPLGCASQSLRRHERE